MNILGVDYGTKHVGVAFSQGELASGVGQFATGEASARIQKLCKDYQVARIVIGAGSRFFKKKIDEFGRELFKTTTIPVVLWDETLTTYEAQIVLQTTKTRKNRKQKEHQTAAALLLQSYIDSL